MALKYTKKTIDNFLKPKNIGKIANPDGYAQIGNMVCGDQLDFFLKVEKGRIKDVKFLSFGCASNIATASIMTEKVKGMTVEEAKKYPWQKTVDDLGGLPHQKVHCSVMAADGLKKAIANYESNLEKLPVKKTAIKKLPSKKVATTAAMKNIKTSIKTPSKTKATVLNQKITKNKTK